MGLVEASIAPVGPAAFRFPDYQLGMIDRANIRVRDRLFPYSPRIRNTSAVSKVDLDNLAIANLVTSWLPALDDMAEKLTAGATVVDVGNGYGARRHPRRTR